MTLLTDIGGAMRAIKDGKRVTRLGWNTTPLTWLALSCGGARTVAAENFWSPQNQAHAIAQGGQAVVLPCVTMKTREGQIQMGWAPAQADLLAEDWLELPSELPQ